MGPCLDFCVGSGAFDGGWSMPSDNVSLGELFTDLAGTKARFRGSRIFGG